MNQVTAECPRTLQPTVDERPSRESKAVTDPTRILIVEDHADSLEWMTALLEQRGYAIKAASDGRTAESIRDSWKPQLVLMDMKLPDTDGTELLSRFRDAAPEAEIVMITGYGSVSNAVDAMKRARVDVMVLGGLLSLSDRRHRVGAPARRTVAGLATAPARR